MYNKKACPNCKNEFIPKRLNQLYCEIKCRTFKNNRLAKAKTEETKSLDIRLHANRLILKSIYAKIAGAEISKDYLLGAGFNFSIYTASCKNDSATYTLWFEYGLTELRKGVFKINPFNISKL